MKKDKNNKIDWRDIRATFVAVFIATIIKHYVFTDKLVEYSLLKDLLIYMVLFIPIYVLMLFLQGKFKKDE